MTDLWILGALMIVAVGVATARGEDYPRAHLLVEPAPFFAEAAGSIRVLDARPREAYLAGHVPGALWVDHAEWARGFGDGDDAEAWALRLGRLGLDKPSRVVVYDDNLAKDAARIWWILRYWGLEHVALMNGGWRGWQSAKLPVEAGDAKAPPPTRPRLEPIAERLSTKDQLLDSLTAGSLQIVDARSEAEHCGIEAMKNKRAGAMPGAVHLEWSDLLDAMTGRFKSPAELAKLLADSGIDLDRPTATHCQSGGRASVMAFGLELMGARDVKNYYKSWAEWGNADDTPIVPGKPRGAPPAEAP